MPELKLFCEPVPNYYYFEKQIIEQLRLDKNNWLVILPVNRAVRQLTKKLIRFSPNGILAAPPIYTFDMLLLKFYREIHPEKMVLSNDILVYLIEEILKKNAGHFEYFPKQSANHTSLIRKIANTISELRRFGYNKRELAKVKDDLRDFSIHKANDFELILATLEEILGDQYIDHSFAVNEAANRLQRDHFQKIFPDVSQIFISGYGLFTPAMFTFIEKTKNWTDVSIKIDFQHENPELFKHTHLAFERLKNMDAILASGEQSEPLALKLFNRDNQAAIFNAEKRFYFLPCSDRTDEVRQISRQIYHLHVNEKIPLEKIGLTFSDMEKYVPFIRRSLNEYGIPFNLSTGYPLKQSPLITTFLNLSDLVIERFEYPLVFNLYQSPFLSANQNASCTMLYKEILKYRIRHLTKGWSENLKKAIRAAGKNINHTLQEQVESLAAFLKPFSEFAIIPQNVSDFHKAYLNLLQNTRAFEWYTKEKSSLDERQQEREYRAYNRFMNLLDQFTWAMQMLYGDSKRETSFWLQHLKSAVGRATFNLTEWPVKAVQIMPRLEIQAMDYNVLFIGGLIDGDFPRSATADIFFSDAVRDQMGLVAGEDLLSQDRYMFYSLLQSAGQRVYMSAPRYEGEKSLVCSTFLDDLQEACTISIIKESESIVSNSGELWQNLGSAVQNQDSAKALSYRHIINDNSMIDAFNELVRRIAAQHKRLALHSQIGIFEGQLQGRDEIQNHLQNAYASFHWSITQLEEYAFCPMKYLFKRLLRLEEWPEFEEEVSPLERGNAVHKILFRFYNRLREKGEAHQPAQNLELLQNITKETLNELPFDGFFWHLEKMRYYGYGENPGLLKTFVNLDQQEINNSGFIPSYFEFCFGTSYDREIDSRSVNHFLKLTDDDLNSIEINGKIDRIDINLQKKQAFVFDYKTGSVAGKNAGLIARGTSFQLPVYILAIEHMLQENLRVIAGGYFQVKDSENCARVPAMADLDEYTFYEGRSKPRYLLPNSTVKIGDEQVSFDELIAFSKKEAIRQQKNIKQAIFRHTHFPDEKECAAFCEFKRVCQKHVSKIKYQNSQKDNGIN